MIEENICLVCGCDYTFDTEASPNYCNVVCSQNCEKELTQKHMVENQNKMEANK